MKPADTARTAWQRFVETFEPLRPELYRYCRFLTRNAWDAEDLVQDALARGLVTLGCLFQDVENPRAWLFRVASNLWIDRQRRAREKLRWDVESAAPKSDRLSLEGQDAAATLRKLIQNDSDRRASSCATDPAPLATRRRGSHPTALSALGDRPPHGERDPLAVPARRCAHLHSRRRSAGDGARRRVPTKGLRFEYKLGLPG